LVLKELVLSLVKDLGGSDMVVSLNGLNEGKKILELSSDGLFISLIVESELIFELSLSIRDSSDHGWGLVSLGNLNHILERFHLISKGHGLEVHGGGGGSRCDECEKGREFHLFFYLIIKINQ
jgi:hypothetical protein